MEMLPGAYSNRFRQFEQEHVQHVKQTYDDEHSEMLARNKRLQQETMRRRRSLAIKRKLEAQKEEKRRQEILAKRREQQREATERFQRLNHGYRDNGSFGLNQGNQPAPALEDALRAVRGSPMPHAAGFSSRHGSASSIRSQPTSSQNTSNRQGSASSVRSQASINGSGHNAGDAYLEAMNRAYPKNSQSAFRNPDERTREHAREVTTRAELQSRSLHNLTNSRSLFEKQLEEQQKLLVDHQRESLHHFNAAIQQEMESDKRLQGEVDDDQNDHEIRSDSPCSVDSLEMGRPDSPPGCSNTKLSHNIPDDKLLEGQTPTGKYSVSNTASSATPTIPRSNATVSSAGFVLHHNYGTSSNVAIVPPTNVTPPTPTNETRTSGLKGSPPSRAYTTEYAVQNNDLKLEDATEVVTDALDQYPRTLSLPAKSDIHDMITASTNGSKSGQFFQDSMVYTTMAPVHSHNYVNNQYSNLTHSKAVPGGYIDSFAGELQSKSNHTFKGNKAWNTSSSGVNGAPVPPNGSFYNQSHALLDLGSTTTVSQVMSNVNPYSSRLTSTSIATNSTASKGETKFSTRNTGILGQETVYPSMNGYQYQVAPGSFAAIGSAQNSSQTKLGSSGFNVQSETRQEQRIEEDDDSEQSQESTSGDEPDDDSKPVPEKTIKGILKKRPVRTSVVRAGGYAAKHLAGPPKRSVSVNSNHSVRDSLEVAKSHVNTRREEVTKVPKKKSVHFAEVISTSQYVDGTIQSKEKSSEPKHTPKPPRPESAKVTSNTPKVDRSVKEGRVASAPVRRGPFIRPSIRAAVANASAFRQQDLINANTGNPKVPFKSATTDTSNTSGNSFSRIPVPKPSEGGNGSPAHTGHRPPATATTNYTNGVNQGIQSGNGDITRKSIEALYDANGLRLDRTPTDEEINWLWDKVRTCLQRESTSVSQSHGTTEKPELSSNNSQHNVQLSQKSIQFPGNGVGANKPPTTTQTTMKAPICSGPSANMTPSAPPKKVTMDNLNSYTRRQGLLQQRPQSGRQSLAGSRTAGYPSSSTSDLMTTAIKQPLSSTYGPTSTYTNGIVQKDVSESMAGFLTAEMMAHQSASDSQIEQAMEKAQLKQTLLNAAKPNDKAPSTLSIEEQRLMQSLDRLNERLKLTEAAVSHGPTTPSGQYVPKPPSQQRSGFRGHQPLSSHQRQYSANTSSTINSRRHLRTSSAGMYRVQPRYH